MAKINHFRQNHVIHTANRDADSGRVDSYTSESYFIRGTDIPSIAAAKRASRAIGLGKIVKIDDVSQIR